MEIRQLSKNLQLKAQNELNEDPARIKEDLEQIKDWLKKQPHLVAREDDYFLLCFLRGCKFSMQKAKQKLDYFYSVRSVVPECFGNRDPFSPEVQLILNSGGILPLPNEDDSTILLVRWSAFNPNTMPYSTIMKVMYMIVDVLMQEDDGAIVSGIHFVPDMKDFPSGYILQFTPNAIQKSNLVMQTAYPLRIKGIDFINVPVFFDKIFSVIRPILSEKLQKRTRVYTEDGFSNLFAHVPQRILPKEYGGTAGSIDVERNKWKKKVESYQQWFINDGQYHCNEELRPQESKNELFGAEGTFKKLSID